MSILILLTVIAVVLFATAVALFKWQDSMYSDWAVVPFVGSICLGLFSIFLLVVVALSAWSWVSAPVRAEIVNKEFGTNYTAQQIFFAEDVIDEIRELKRTRVSADIKLEKSEKPAKAE